MGLNATGPKKIVLSLFLRSCVLLSPRHVLKCLDEYLIRAHEWVLPESPSLSVEP